jgi:ubiquinone/menaquinone biosynthesis C-methylase UbiE
VEWQASRRRTALRMCGARPSGTMRSMTEQACRYDRIAQGYARWWAPVIAPAALRVLDEVESAVSAGATELLDVGTGTGTLAIAAIRRWPGIRVTAIDASGGMIEAAGAEADRLLDRSERARLDLRVAFADELGLPDESFDVAVSSFVLQLVPSRPRALREIRRVLRRRGTLAWASWLSREGEAWLPDDDFDDALEAVDEEPRGWDDGPRDDIPGPSAAIAQMRRAGFADVTAEAGDLVHSFTIDEYVGFMFEFDEDDLVAKLEPVVRRRFESELRRRLARRTADELALHHRTVTVRGTRT